MAWKRWLVLVPVIGVLPAFVAACATIMHGTSQEVSIGSSPTGAKVTVDGKDIGKTPLVADLKRKDKHSVRIELAGYEPFEMAMSRGTSGWVWGNIVFGGLVGLAVDAITGGMYKLKPEQIQGALQREVVMRHDTNQLVIAVVLRPSSDWERIGSLERE